MARATRYFTLAADQGHADAQTTLAVCYTKGDGVAQSYTEAVRLFKLAADEDDSDAQFHLAVLYENGLGVKQDRAELTFDGDVITAQQTPESLDLEDENMMDFEIL
ncbi:hypothetical protein T492DRAFT_878104 [Pavlovales sp. CCMP2436]|nr:hypothetical protein T492DRAFT_878104 [Pavlovales sp. CCMP2436]